MNLQAMLTIRSCIFRHTSTTLISTCFRAARHSCSACRSSGKRGPAFSVYCPPMKLRA